MENDESKVRSSPALPAFLVPGMSVVVDACRWVCMRGCKQMPCKLRQDLPCPHRCIDYYFALCCAAVTTSYC